ncbi:hypothetical protein AVEN_138710-1 [Araneus ventricosus]|uniref:RNase H type-1 domain-containing protein n=1 Tax=Araneus ventricosus TaxID=182803 RepID=A0A4Y2GIP7_ARAVE|nr:hypothetical protein AVEN_138710-1 [Araneus ventricosus]
MVGLSWVKAHVGIPGNKLADQQAKLAITSGEKFVIPAPYSHLKGLLKNYIVKEWNEYWNSYDSASGIRVRGYINQCCEVVKNSRNSHKKVTGPPSSLAESGRRKGPTKSFQDCVIPEGLRLKLTATGPRVGHTSSQGNALRTPRANAIEELKTEFCHWEKGPHLQQMKS